MTEIGASARALAGPGASIASHCIPWVEHHAELARSNGVDKAPS